jgi:hypothetical protein
MKVKPALTPAKSRPVKGEVKDNFPPPRDEAIFFSETASYARLSLDAPSMV